MQTLICLVICLDGFPKSIVDWVEHYDSGSLFWRDVNI